MRRERVNRFYFNGEYRMSKNAKTVLIIFGILAFLGLVCVGVVGFFVYQYMDTAAFEKADREGSEFGRTTDNFGCQTKVVEMIRPMGSLEITGSMTAKIFFDKCLRTSRSNPDFCKNVPNEFSDIINDDKWKTAECEKLGFKDGNMPCRTVMKAKTEFCGFK